MTKKTATITDLEHSIQEAQAALNAAPEADRPDLEAQINQKSAQLEAMQGEQQQAYASEHDELLALRQQSRDIKIRETASEVAQQIAAGVKSAQAKETERIGSLVQAEISKALGGDGTVAGGFDIKSLVQQSLAGVRLGRKTPPMLTEDQGEVRYAPAQKSNKGTFMTFMRAVANKDRAAITEVYRAHGMKALVEGGGAGSSGSLSAGGALVPPEFATEIVDLLRAASVVRKAGPEIRTMTSPIYYQPRLASAATAQYVGETVAIPPSQETFDQITLTAHKLSALTVVSNELLRDSDPSVEQVVRADLAAVIALKEDAQFLYGTGSATTPTGLFKRSDIQAIAPGTNGDAVTYNTPLQMWYKLVSANMPMLRPAWFANPAMVKMLLGVTDTNGRPIFTNFFDVQQSTLSNNRQIGFAGTLFGAPVFTTTQIPLGTTGSGTTSSMALIDMSQILIGQMADIYIDTSNEASFYDGSNTISLWQSDLTGFRALMRHDITAMHGSAICVYSGLLYS